MSAATFVAIDAKAVAFAFDELHRPDRICQRLRVMLLESRHSGKQRLRKRYAEVAQRQTETGERRRKKMRMRAVAPDHRDVAGRA